MNWQEKLHGYMEHHYGADMSDDQLKEVQTIILEGHEGLIFKSEMEKVRETRRECVRAMIKCVDNYSPFASKEVMKEDLEHAIMNESSTPNLTNSVRYILTV